MGERAGFPRQEGLYKAWLEDPKTQLFFFFSSKGSCVYWPNALPAGRGSEAEGFLEGLGSRKRLPDVLIWLLLLCSNDP